jgi:hypothetical protein
MLPLLIPYLGLSLSVAGHPGDVLPDGQLGLAAGVRRARRSLEAARAGHRRPAPCGDRHEHDRAGGVAADVGDHSRDWRAWRRGVPSTRCSAGLQACGSPQGPRDVDASLRRLARLCGGAGAVCAVHRLHGTEVVAARDDPRTARAVVDTAASAGDVEPACARAFDVAHTAACRSTADAALLHDRAPHGDDVRLHDVYADPVDAARLDDR